MSGLIRAEFRKLWTTRSAAGIVAAMIAVIVLSVLQTSGPMEATKPIWERQFYFLATLHARLFLLVLGIKLVTDEFRFGTIVPSVLVTPKRERLVIAKIAVGAMVGAIAALVAVAAMLMAALPELGGLDGRELRALAGFVAAGTLWVPLGIGFGLVVRHQLGAVVAGIVWVMAVEQLVMSRLPNDFYLPGGAGGALAVSEATASMLVGGAVLLAYTAAFALAGGLTFARGDVR